MQKIKMKFFMNDLMKYLSWLLLFRLWEIQLPTPILNPVVWEISPSKAGTAVGRGIAFHFMVDLGCD